MRRAIVVLWALGILAGCKAPDLSGVPECAWDFDFPCRTAAGASVGVPIGHDSVAVSAATTGPVADSSGYPLVARWYDLAAYPAETGHRSYRLPINGQVWVSVPSQADSLTLALDSLPAGCEAADNPRELSLRGLVGDTLKVAFEVACTAP